MTNQRQLLHPRDEILQAMERIYRYRMTTTSGGNVSVRQSDGSIWITPARVDKGSLTRSDVIHVLPDGTIEGPHRPSSEFPFHQAIYKARPDLRAVVHAHPVALVAFSICGTIPNTRIFHQAFFMSGKVGFAPYALPGSSALGDSIAKQFAAGCESVIMENHGVVVAGKSLSHAFERFEAFEFAAKTLLKANRIGTPRYLSDDELALANKRKISMNSFVPGEPSDRERECRKQLIDFLRRGCRQRLLISTEGSFSARIDSEHFLITPSQSDRERLRIDDLVLVRGNAHEAGKVPSRATRLHQAIYEKHSSVQSVVFAHPVNATAFSVTEGNFDARTIPESYIFLRDVARITYGVQYEKGNSSIADIVSLKSPAALVENDGVVVLGTSILDAFDRLEVLESTAEAIINAGSIGVVTPMSNDVIDELRIAFKMENVQ
jgi:L-fuculose-phosphate aldolase